MSFVSVEKLQKSYAGSPVFDDIDCQIQRGEFVTLLGPSGCGKSTLLRCIAGLTPVDSGRILLDGHDLVPLSPQKRGIGMVFQSYALFPNMTVSKTSPLVCACRKPPLKKAARGCAKCSSWSSWAALPGAIRISCRAASASGWRWPDRW